VTQLILGLILFFGAHSVAIVSPRARDALAAKLGAQPWRIVYSLVSLVGFVLIVRGYAAARLDPQVIYTPPAFLRHVTALLMLPVFPLLLASSLPGRIKTATQHPMLAATKIWAFAHLLANGMLADVLLFGGFLVWAVLDRISLGRRPPKVLPMAPPSKFNDAIAVVGGLVLYGVFVMWAHVHLIGVAALP
jgi:uncharacterized membrane protein